MSFNPNIQDSSNTREERTERAERGQTRDVRSERSSRVHSNVRNFQSRNTNTVDRERVGSKEAWMNIGDVSIPLKSGRCCKHYPVDLLSAK